MSYINSAFCTTPFYNNRQYQHNDQYRYRYQTQHYRQDVSYARREPLYIQRPRPQIIPQYPVQDCYPQYSGGYAQPVCPPNFFPPIWMAPGFFPTIIAVGREVGETVRAIYGKGGDEGSDAADAGDAAEKDKGAEGAGDAVDKEGADAASEKADADAAAKDKEATAGDKGADAAAKKDDKAAPADAAKKDDKAAPADAAAKKEEGIPPLPPGCTTKVTATAEASANGEKKTEVKTETVPAPKASSFFAPQPETLDPKQVEILAKFLKDINATEHEINTDF